MRNCGYSSTRMSTRLVIDRHVRRRRRVLLSNVTVDGRSLAEDQLVRNGEGAVGCQVGIPLRECTDPRGNRICNTFRGDASPARAGACTSRRGIERPKCIVEER